jgi:hypothetical protein
MNASADDDGVIGYHAQTVAPPQTQLSAAARCSMKMRLLTRSAQYLRPLQGLWRPQMIGGEL